MASAFPTFEVPEQNRYKHRGDASNINKFQQDSLDLGYYAVNGYMAGDNSKSFGRYVQLIRISNQVLDKHDELKYIVGILLFPGGIRILSKHRMVSTWVPSHSSQSKEKS